jgi:hypothetical protein
MLILTQNSAATYITLSTAFTSFCHHIISVLFCFIFIHQSGKRNKKRRHLIVFFSKPNPINIAQLAILSFLYLLPYRAASFLHDGSLAILKGGQAS